jgi:hypothetical protein
VSGPARSPKRSRASRLTATVHLDVAKTIVALAVAALVVYLICAGAPVEAVVKLAAGLRP